MVLWTYSSSKVTRVTTSKRHNRKSFPIPLEEAYECHSVLGVDAPTLPLISDPRTCGFIRISTTAKSLNMRIKRKNSDKKGKFYWDQCNFSSGSKKVVRKRTSQSPEILNLQDLISCNKWAYETISENLSKISYECKPYVRRRILPSNYDDYPKPIQSRSHDVR